MVPLEDNLNGVGRVLIINEATIFMELYRMKPIADASQFIFEDAIKEKPIVMNWCYDDALRKGEAGEAVLDQRIKVLNELKVKLIE